MEQLALALRTEMRRRGHSYRQAAGTLGVSSGTVVNWSKGWVEHAPRPGHWCRLADYIGVPMFIVLGWLGLLSDEQIGLVRTLPGLAMADGIALRMADQQLVLELSA